MQTIQNHNDSGAKGELPPIRIWISDGKEDVVFKIDDEGGGMPTSDLPKVWSYIYPAYSPQVNPPSAQYPFKVGYPLIMPGLLYSKDLFTAIFQNTC